jgi:hypothetical protein
MTYKKSSQALPQANKNRVQKTDLSPDGIRILIEWENITIGASIFVPAVDTPELIAQFYDAMPKDWKIEHRTRIENGKWGVRFWRML